MPSWEAEQSLAVERSLAGERSERLRSIVAVAYHSVPALLRAHAHAAMGITSGGDRQVERERPERVDKQDPLAVAVLAPRLAHLDAAPIDPAPALVRVAGLRARRLPVVELDCE